MELGGRRTGLEGGAVSVVVELRRSRGVEKVEGQGALRNATSTSRDTGLLVVRVYGGRALLAVVAVCRVVVPLLCGTVVFQTRLANLFVRLKNSKQRKSAPHPPSSTHACALAFTHKIRSGVC